MSTTQNTPIRVKTRVQNKYDTKENFDKASFIPLKGEIVFYDVDGTLANRRMKVGDGTTSIGELPFVELLSPEYKTYLDNQLYQKPTISSFSMVSGSKEVGQSVTVSSFTHYETNIGNINGTLTLKKGSTTIQSGIAPKSSNTSVNLSTAQTITSSSAATIKYTLSGKDTKGNSFSRENSISFYFPSWYGYASTDSITDVSGLTKVASANLDGTKTVTTEAVGYVYFVTTDTISKITSGGFDVTTTNGTLILNINGVNKTYNVYRTNQLNPGTLSYVIS